MSEPVNILVRDDGFTEHYGVEIGPAVVAELGGKDVGTPTWRLVRPEQFGRGRRVRRKRGSLAREQAVARLAERSKTHTYNLLTYNCETAANDIANGNPTSRQALLVLASTVAGAIIAHDRGIHVGKGAAAGAIFGAAVYRILESLESRPAA